MAPMVAHFAYRMVVLSCFADRRQKTFLCLVIVDLVLSVRIAARSPIWGNYHKLTYSSTLRLHDEVRIEVDSLAFGAAYNRFSDVYDFFCGVKMIESLNLACLLLAS